MAEGYRSRALLTVCGYLRVKGIPTVLKQIKSCVTGDTTESFVQVMDVCSTSILVWT